MKIGANQTQAEFRQAVADSVPCPFMATMVKQGNLALSPDGMVSFEQLRKALALVGLSLGSREILVRGTQSVEKDRLERAGKLVTQMESFDISKLSETTLMHTGDLKIRRGGFSQERLDWLLGFSSDGTTLTLKDLARAQEEAVAKDPGVRGRVIGLAEISALLRLFGERNAGGDKALSKQALTALFRDNVFPAGWEPKRLGLEDVFGNMAKIAFQQVFTTTGRAAAGLDKALERQSPVDQSGVTSLGKALCPVGMRPTLMPVSQKELQSLHGDAE